MSFSTNSIKNIGKFRVTVGVDEHSNAFNVVDKWKDLKDPHARCVRVTGTTFFVDNLEDASKLIEHGGMGGNEVIPSPKVILIVYAPLNVRSYRKTLRRQHSVEVPTVVEYT